MGPPCSIKKIFFTKKNSLMYKNIANTVLCRNSRNFLKGMLKLKQCLEVVKKVSLQSFTLEFYLYWLVISKQQTGKCSTINIKVNNIPLFQMRSELTVQTQGWSLLKIFSNLIYIFHQWLNIHMVSLKVFSATFLLVCLSSLNETTCQTRKNIFYFSSKGLFVP